MQHRGPHVARAGRRLRREHRPHAAFNLRSDAGVPQLHFAPAMPPLIQSSDFTPGGGLTHSAGKYWMSTRSTRFRSGLYLVRLMAIGWSALGASGRFLLIKTP